MHRSLKSTAAVVAAGVLFAAGGITTAVAGNLITGDDIAKNTITGQNLAKNSVGKSELQPGLAANGKKGQDGAQGPAGEQGPAGPQGPAGEQGPKGDTGSVGATGAQGPVGATGAVGAQGEQGPAGLSGYYVTNRTQPVEPNSTATFTIPCDKYGSDYVALGGGVTPETADDVAALVVVGTGPALDLTKVNNRYVARGWTVTVRNPTNATRAFMPWVTCAQLTSQPVS